MPVRGSGGVGRGRAYLWSLPGRDPAAGLLGTAAGVGASGWSLQSGYPRFLLCWACVEGGHVFEVLLRRGDIGKQEALVGSVEDDDAAVEHDDPW